MRLVFGLFAALFALIALPAVAQGLNDPRPPVASITDPQNLWYLDLSNGGRVTIWLRPDVAPRMVERIRTLTRQKFYDGLLFHRVIENFMAQSGDPRGDGTGGSTLGEVPAEFNYLPHARGAVGAAHTEADTTGNSQFYITFGPQLYMDQKYTVFGRVISGMQYVDAIQLGEPPANPTRILRAYIAADNPPAYQPPVATPAPAAVVAPAPAPRPARPATPVQTRRKR